MRRSSTSVTPPKGFTLAELAVVLVIVGLLLGGLMIPLSAQMDIRAQSDAKKLFSDIREALLGFALTHSATDGKPYLPCPDTDDDGAENRTGNVCTNQEGRIPWADLGLPAIDAWNNRIRYRVDNIFSNNANGFTLEWNGTLRVCTTAGGTCTAAAKLADNLPAVFLSHGKNGAGAFNSSGGTNTASTDTDELENTDGDNRFVSKTPVEHGFDDLVDWLPPGILFNRLVTAGKLP